GAQPEQVGALQADACAQPGDLLVGGGHQVGAQRGDGDPLGGDAEVLDQVGGGGGRDAQDPVGGGHGAAQRPAEVADLGRLVPLGVRHQGQVVHGDHGRQPGAQRQLVVEAVEEPRAAAAGGPAGGEL